MKSDKSPPAPGWPLPRAEVENLSAYSAPLEGRRELLRLDFNENTIGPSPKVIEALKNIPAHHISIYPEYTGLKEALVANLHTTKLSESLRTEQIGIFNGVDAAIHAIFHAYGDRGDLLLTTTPTFGYYKPCAHMQGMEILSIPYEENDFQFPFEKIKTALCIEKPRLLLICNPNNPTGTKLSAEKILELATAAPETLVVIDELYEAFSDTSVLPIVDFSTVPNLVILRSLSKTAGLAGLRIGFAIGNSDVINRVSRVTGPYDINGFAVKAAFSALEDQAYIDSYVAEVLRARNWIQTQLIKHSVRHHIAGGNYFLIWPKRKATEINQCLKKEGILVRDMSTKPLISGSLRVSIGTKEQMSKFWDAFLLHEFNESS